MGITKRENFNEMQNKISLLAKTVSHPARVAILQRIFSKHGTICNDLVIETGLSQPTISQHLNELKKAGLIHGKTVGTRMCYQIVPEKWEDFKRTFATFLSLDEKPSDNSVVPSLLKTADQINGNGAWKEKKDYSL